MGEAARCEGALSLRAVHGDGGESDAIMELAYEPGGRRYVAVYESGKARIRDARTGQVLASFDLESSDSNTYVVAAFDVARRGIVCAMHEHSKIFTTAPGAPAEGRTKFAYLSEATGLVSPCLAPLAGVLKDFRVAPDGSAVWISIAEASSHRNPRLVIRLYAGGLDRLLLAYDASGSLRSDDACGAFASDAKGRVTALLIDAARDRVDVYDPVRGDHCESRSLLPDWAGARGGSVVRCTSDGQVLLLQLIVGEYDRMDYVLAARRLDAADAWREVGPADWYHDVWAFGRRVACVVDQNYERVEVRSLDHGGLLGSCFVSDVCSVALAPDDRALLIGTNTGEVLVLSIDPRP